MNSLAAYQKDRLREGTIMQPVGGMQRLRKSVTRKTIDAATSVLNQRSAHAHRADAERDAEWLQARTEDVFRMEPPSSYPHLPATSICSRFVHSAVNVKAKTPIYQAAWTPDGRRVVAASQSGEFTLWSGSAFHFESILQAHECAVRTLCWSRSGNWLLAGDDSGTVKYWEPNLRNARAIQAHKEPCRCVDFAPSDLKYVTGSDDTTAKIWDFASGKEEMTLAGHGWDVKATGWHPHKAMVATGGKDNLVKLWDVHSGKELATMHGHKNTVMNVKWNDNGNWLLTCSRDSLAKVMDVRMMKELQTFRGHKRDVTCCTWHPIHNEYFVTGGFDGSLNHWIVGEKDPVQESNAGQDQAVWSASFNPQGHILATGSQDHTTKFWSRNRPGENLVEDSHAAAVHARDDEDMRASRYARDGGRETDARGGGAYDRSGGGAEPAHATRSSGSGSAIPGLAGAGGGMPGIPGVGGGGIPGLGGGGAIPGLAVGAAAVPAAAGATALLGASVSASSKPIDREALLAGSKRQADSRGGAGSNKRARGGPPPFGMPPPMMGPGGMPHMMPPGGPGFGGTPGMAPPPPGMPPPPGFPGGPPGPPGQMGQMGGPPGPHGQQQWRPGMPPPMGGPPPPGYPPPPRG